VALAADVAAAHPELAGVHAALLPRS
jgi:hypothetical protein